MAIAFVVAAGAAAFVMTGASGDGEERTRYRIVFDNAFGLTEGGDFRVGGVRVGQTVDHQVVKRPGEPPRAVVVAEVDEPAFADLRQDASCEVRPQSLIGEYYVDCQPGAGQRLPADGSGTVPVEQTASTIPQDVVNNMLREPYRDRFRIILSQFGAALAGRPEDLSEAIRRAHPGLRETTRVLNLLGDQNRVIERFIADADTVVAELEERKEDVSRFVVEAGDAAEATAARQDELRATLARLPGFLEELEPTMARLSDAAQEQVPLLDDLRTAAPDLDHFVDRLGPFAEGTRPALRSLGDAARTGNRAFAQSGEEVDELRELAAEAPGAFEPLRKFLQTSDDRKRAIDEDARGKVGGPPETDRSHEEGRGGFTAIESFWNYFYWQTLSINGFDPVGHVLRIGLTASKCSPFQNIGTLAQAESGDERFIEDCNQWLGPDQPGVTTEDFTTGKPPAFPGLQPRAELAAASQPRGAAEGGGAGEQARDGDRREPGDPEAQQPEPGERDVSQPQVVLPPAIQELAESLEQRLTGPSAGSRPGAGEPRDAPTQLLDFLLAP